MILEIIPLETTQTILLPKVIYEINSFQIPYCKRGRCPSRERVNSRLERYFAPCYGAKSGKARTFGQGKVSLKRMLKSKKNSITIRRKRFKPPITKFHP